MRFSVTDPIKCPFTISINSKPKKDKKASKDKKKKAPAVINHIRVFCEENSYYIHKPPPNQAEKVSAPTLEALMKKIKDEKVLGIKEVCSKGVSPYSDLFVVNNNFAAAGGSYLPCDGGVGDDSDGDDSY